jgi:hypothetical protein
MCNIDTGSGVEYRSMVIKDWYNSPIFEMGRQWGTRPYVPDTTAGGGVMGKKVRGTLSNPPPAY